MRQARAAASSRDARSTQGIRSHVRVCMPAGASRSSADRRAPAWETRRTSRRRNSRGPSRSALVRLRSQEPLARVCRVAERRGRFVGGRLPRRADGRARRSRSSARWVSCEARLPARVAGTAAMRRVTIVGRLLTTVYQIDAKQLRRHAHGGAHGRRGDRRRAPRTRRRRRCVQSYTRNRRGASAASSRGRPTTSRCRTSRRAPRRRRCGCSPTSRTPCCSRRAIAPRRPSATRRWTATPAAGSAPSPASTRRSCAAGCGGSKPTGPRAWAASRRCASSTRWSRPPSCARTRPTRPTKTTSCRTTCSTRSRSRDRREARRRWKCSRADAPQFPQYIAGSLAVWVERFFRAVEPQPVEARALRAVVSPRRQEPRPQDLVPVSHPLRRLRA